MTKQILISFDLHTSKSETEIINEVRVALEPLEPVDLDVKVDEVVSVRAELVEKVGAWPQPSDK